MTTNDDDAGCVAVGVVAVILGLAVAAVMALGWLLWGLAGRLGG